MQNEACGLCCEHGMPGPSILAGFGGTGALNQSPENERGKDQK
jgi:hypothetical protein